MYAYKKLNKMFSKPRQMYHWIFHIKMFLWNLSLYVWHGIDNTKRYQQKNLHNVVKHYRQPSTSAGIVPLYRYFAQR